MLMVCTFLFLNVAMGWGWVKPKPFTPNNFFNEVKDHAVDTVTDTAEAVHGDWTKDEDAVGDKLKAFKGNVWWKRKKLPCDTTCGCGFENTNGKQLNGRLNTLVVTSSDSSWWTIAHCRRLCMMRRSEGCIGYHFAHGAPNGQQSRKGECRTFYHWHMEKRNGLWDVYEVFAGNMKPQWTSCARLNVDLRKDCRELYLQSLLPGRMDICDMDAARDCASYCSSGPVPTAGPLKGKYNYKY